MDEQDREWFIGQLVAFKGDIQKEAYAMHIENVKRFARLETIATETKNLAERTNGRVTILETTVRFISDEFHGIRSRWHKFRDSMQDTVSRVELHLARSMAKPVKLIGGDDMMITPRIVAWIFAILAVGAAIGVAWVKGPK